MTYLAETTSLTHRFQETEPVLNGISLKVPEGSIYGFLGPNGAGKTTTLRLLLGLLRVQQGSVFLFGKPLKHHRVELMQQVGSLIESPSLYGQLTAAENLQVHAKVYRTPSARVGEVLKLVGLSQTGKKKAGQFSLGMKQRLSIAIALLHRPPLLVLDEPTNGLDPNGIIEMRELLRRLNLEEGVTILVSSHLLAEIEKTVTHAGIIHKGKLIFQGSLAELKAMQKQTLAIHLITGDATRTQEVLSAMGIPAQREEEIWKLPALSQPEVAALTVQLVEAGVPVHEISPVRNDLEHIFMNLIAN